MKTFVIGDIHGRCAQLYNLLEMLPRDESADKLVFLGDLIDRGRDIPGCVEHVLNLCSENPELVICLRGNHEQMLLDFLDEANLIWMETSTGSDQTFAQYTGAPLRLRSEADFDTARDLVKEKIPATQIEFFRQLPLYHEDDFALYVHAGLENGKHPREEFAARAAMDARHGFLQKLSRQALRVWAYADAVPSFARPPGSARYLSFPQRHRHRHRLQPALAAVVLVAA